MTVEREIVESSPGESFRVLRWSSTLRDVTVVHGPDQLQRLAGRGGGWHRHSVAELTWFGTGSGTQFVGDFVGEFTAPNLVLIGPGAAHYWQEEGPSSGVSVQWGTDGPMALLPEYAVLSPLVAGAKRGIAFSTEVADRVGNQMQECADAAGLDRLTRFMGILSELSGLAPSEHTTLSKSFRSGEGADSQANGIDRAVRFVAAHFRRRIGVSDVIKEAALSRATFYRHFELCTGKSFGDFLASVRVEHARRELVASNKRIVEIAYGVGFGAVSSLNRRFLETFGVSPSEYRARVRSGDRPGSLHVEGGQ